MKMTWLILATVVAAFAQAPTNAGLAFQQAGVILTQAAGGPLKIEARGAELMAPPPVAGSPFTFAQGLFRSR